MPFPVWCHHQNSATLCPNETVPNQCSVRSLQTTIALRALIPDVLVEGPGTFPTEIDTRLSIGPRRSEAPTDRKLLPVDSADPAVVLVAIARQLGLQRDFWKKGVVGYREAPRDANTPNSSLRPQVGSSLRPQVGCAELKRKRSSRALEGAIALSYEKSKRPELGRAPQACIRGEKINVGEIQNVARRRTGCHRETTAAPGYRRRESSARGGA